MNRLLPHCLTALAALCSLCPTLGATERIVGGDLSLITAYEEAGDQWLDANRQPIADLLPYVKEQGWNCVRLRLFLDPTQDSDPSTCQSLPYVRELARRVKRAGLRLMLDLHYSDTWADPGQQRIPSAWARHTTDEALAAQVRQYTEETVRDLIRNAAAPDYVQLGNEITYGLLWRTTDGTYPKQTTQHAAAGYCTTWAAAYSAGATQWRRTASLLNNAAHGVRQAFHTEGLDSTSVRLVLHTEMGNSAYNQDHFYRHIRTAGFTNYDIIGLSYYPFWHGPLQRLGSLLDLLQRNFPEKEVQLVETAWYNSWYPYTQDGTNAYAIASLNPRWTANAQGVVNYLTDLCAYLQDRPQVTGLLYWAPEECGNGYRKTVMNSYLNRGLWHSTSGQRHPMLQTADGTTGVRALAAFLSQGETAIAPPRLRTTGREGLSFDLSGRPATPHAAGLCVRDGKKHLRTN